jgi:hypothetical protein
MNSNKAWTELGYANKLHIMQDDLTGQETSNIQKITLI